MRKRRVIRIAIFTLLFVVLTVFIVGLYFRTFHGDEIILAEQVLSLQENGFVKAELFNGMGKGWEIRQYHYHKFFILFGAFITSIFELDIWVLRTISLVFFIGLIFLLSRYLKINATSDPLIIGITLTVLLINSTIFEYAFIFRPEIMVAALGFLSFLLLFEFTRHDNIWICIGAGAIAGLAAFTHLNGLSYILAGGLILLFFSRWKGALLFGFSAGLIALLYFFDLQSTVELTAFWEQFRSDPNLSESDLKVLHAFLRIFNEHMRFFWNPPVIAFSLLYLFCLVSNFSHLKKEHPMLLWYHLILIACLSAIAQSKTVKYGLIYFPFMVLIISIAFYRMYNDSGYKIRLVILSLALFAIYLFTNFGFSIRNMTKDSTAYLMNKNEVYSKYLTKENANVLTTQSFYFNSYENYNLRLILAYELLHEVYLKTPRSKEGFFRFASEGHNDYILLRNRPNNRNMLSLIEFDDLLSGASCFGYKIIFKDREVVIMEKEMPD